MPSSVPSSSSCSSDTMTISCPQPPQVTMALYSEAFFSDIVTVLSSSHA